MNGNGSTGRADIPYQIRRSARAIDIKGVHRPPMSRPPQAIGVRTASSGPASAVRISIATQEEANTHRRISRPNPGQEFGNIVKRRCMMSAGAYEDAGPGGSTRKGEV